MDLSSILAVVGLALAVAGIAATIIQTERASRIKRRSQDVLRFLIDRANYVKFDHEIIEELTECNPDPLLARYLWLLHQAGSDLYMTLVDEYLAGEKRFTFADLQRISGTSLVGGRWQFRYWLSKLTGRPENQGADLPSFPDDYNNFRLDRHKILRERAQRTKVGPADGTPPD
jgi:hypothetical protein